MCWKAIRTQQMRGFNVVPCPLARLPLSWLHCQQWFTEEPQNQNSGSATFFFFLSSSSDCLSQLWLDSFNMILYSTFSYHDRMSPTVQTYPWSKRDGALMALLSEMFVIWQMGGGWKWAEARFKFNPGGSGGNPSPQNDQSAIQPRQSITVQQRRPLMISNVHSK